MIKRNKLRYDNVFLKKNKYRLKPFSVMNTDVFFTWKGKPLTERRTPKRN